MGLRLQLFVAVMLAGAVPVLLLGSYYAQTLSDALSEEVDRENQVVAEATAAQLEQLIEQLLQRMRIIAEEADQFADPEPLTRILDQHRVHTPELIAVIVMDDEGNVVAGSPQSTQDGSATQSLNYSDRDYFQDIAAGANESISGVLRSKTTGMNAIGVAVARRGRDGSFDGVVVCTLQRAILDKAVRNVAKSVRRLSIDVFDASDRPVASSRADTQFLEVTPPELFKRPEETRAIRRGRGPEGKLFDVAVVQMEKALTPWHVVSSRPSRLRELRVRNAWLATTLATLGVAVVALLIALVLAVTVVSPVRIAVRTIEALERGDLTVRSTGPRPWDAIEIRSLLDASRRAVDHLRLLVSNVRSTSKTVALVLDGIDETSGELREHSVRTAERVESSIGALQSLTQSSDRIHDAVQTLSVNTTGTAESAGLLEGAASSIVDNMESLGSAIGTVVDGVQRMEGEVGGLTTGIQTTNRSVERVSFSLAALNHGVSAVEQAAQESAQLANKTTRDAQNGRDAAEETIRAMSDITASFTRLNESITALAARSDAIDRVIEVIDNVTRATNLLAFNASIIAAQAGEHGAGFAVVAERVKSLADSTRQSTRDISDLIIEVRDDIGRAVEELHESARSIHDGETLSLKSVESLAVIIESSEEAAAMVERISSATEQQSERLVDLKRSVDELRSVNDALERSAGEQKKALQYIESSVINTRDVNEVVSATARAQAQETANISASAKTIDHRTQDINLVADEQRAGTGTLQATMESFAESAEAGAVRSVRLDRAVRELTEHLGALEESLNRFRTD